MKLMPDWSIACQGALLHETVSQNYCLSSSGLLAKRLEYYRSQKIKRNALNKQDNVNNICVCLLFLTPASGFYCLELHIVWGSALRNRSRQHKCKMNDWLWFFFLCLFHFADTVMATYWTFTVILFLVLLLFTFSLSLSLYSPHFYLFCIPLLFLVGPFHSH